MGGVNSSDNIETIRNCTVWIENNSSYYGLDNPHVYMDSGRAHIDPKPMVSSKQSSECSFTKRYDTACGAVGVLTYDIVHNESGNRRGRLALMFSVPYDYVLYSNWVAVGIFQNTCKCDHELYRLMYFHEGSEFNRGNKEVAYRAGVVHLNATMTNLGKCDIKLVVSDK